MPEKRKIWPRISTLARFVGGEFTPQTLVNEHIIEREDAQYAVEALVLVILLFGIQQRQLPWQGTGTCVQRS